MDISLLEFPSGLSLRVEDRHQVVEQTQAKKTKAGTAIELPFDPPRHSYYLSPDRWAIITTGQSAASIYPTRSAASRSIRPVFRLNVRQIQSLSVVGKHGSNRERIHVASVVSRPFQENTYIAWLDGHTDCLVVDPGLEPARIIELLDTEELTPAAILNTHGHSDHIAGNGAMKRRWPDCPLVIGENETGKLSDPWQNLSADFGAAVVSPPADATVREGDIYQAAGFDLLVREIPGHSSGHVVFIWRAGSPQVVFGGDVLFAGSVGRTDDKVGGSFAQLARGIREKLFTLPDDTIVLPGHGPATTVGEEKRSNPFVGGSCT
jgi:hydroxyacylglutathione hydrolase